MERSVIDELLNDMAVAPEVLLPSQARGAQQPTAEMRLVLAVMEDAIRIFLKYDAKGRKPPKYFDVVEWFKDDSQLPFSFVGICESVGIDVRAFRERLSQRLIQVPLRRQHPIAAQPGRKRAA